MIIYLQNFQFSAVLVGKTRLDLLVSLSYSWKTNIKFQEAKITGKFQVVKRSIRFFPWLSSGDLGFNTSFKVIFLNKAPCFLS